MDKFINILEFMGYLFDEKEAAEKAAPIIEGILAAGSARTTHIANKMDGNADANYKHIQRFLKVVDPREELYRLFQPEAEYVIGDPTEMERPQAWKTEYVGTLKDGKTKGYWLMVLGTPYRGRVLPCGFVSYSSRTIAENSDSRNLNHFRAFQQVKEILGEKPLILDREFSYLGLLLRLVEEQVNFVIRLNLSGAHPPHFFDSEGKRVSLEISPGKTEEYAGIYYMGKICVNVIGSWKEGFDEPLWVMTNLSAKDGLRLYFHRMKIEQSFRDLKTLLGMNKLMNKKQNLMEKMVALALIAFAVGLLVGEALRDHLYAEVIAPDEEVEQKQRVPGKPFLKKSRKWKAYSGLYVLLKQKIKITDDQLVSVVNDVLVAFGLLTQHPVRT